MKVTDLIINDWVKWMGNECKVDLPLLMTDYQDNVDSEFVNPIPLTVEILKKNGFERNEYFDYNGRIYFSFPIGEFSKRSRFGIEKKDDEYYITDHALMPMRYVHELQHALRLCGLGELANNFKI